MRTGLLSYHFWSEFNVCEEGEFLTLSILLRTKAVPKMKGF